MADNTLTLRHLFETLPQELCDEIYDLTFTAAPGRRDIPDPVKVAEAGAASKGDILECHDRSIRFCDHDSPSLFLVDHASSAKFAASYFGGENAEFTFRVLDVKHTPQTFVIMLKWCKRLSTAHRALVRRIKIAVTSENMSPGSLIREMMRMSVVARLGDGFVDKVFLWDSNSGVSWRYTGLFTSAKQDV